MLVLTNEEKREGAALLLDEGILEKISKVMDGGYYVIPSSIHEAIIVNGFGMNEDAIENLTLEDMDTYTMISKRIENEDILSNKSQYYDPEEKVLMDALKYERKQKFKDVTYEIESNSQEKVTSSEKSRENPRKEQKKREMKK